MDVQMINPDVFGRFGHDVAEWFTRAAPLLVGTIVLALALSALLAWAESRRDH